MLCRRKKALKKKNLNPKKPRFLRNVVFKRYGAQATSAEILEAEPWLPSARALGFRSLGLGMFRV